VHHRRAVQVKVGQLLNTHHLHSADIMPPRLAWAWMLQIIGMANRFSLGIGLVVCNALAHAHEAMPTIDVVAHYDNAIGNSDAASQGVVQADLLHSRALVRPADALEFIPGMVVTQHSGDGKANQYFLRGMNLDHGSDFATSVNGIPVNLPTHAHGHGYSDLNLLIPELVQNVHYKKGPYFASEGDFSSAGSAQFLYRTELPRDLLDVSVGQRGYVRGLAADSRSMSDGVTLLSAIEHVQNDGPWAVHEHLRKLNAQFILSSGSPREGWTTSVSAYRASWTATDQVPLSLINNGTLGRYESLDPTDGGYTQRTSVSGTWHQASEQSRTHINWYALQYDLDLFSNFTYFQKRAQGDQFAQSDHRTAIGGAVARSWLGVWGDRAMVNTLGVQLRQDRIRVGLFNTQARVTDNVNGTVRDDTVQQTQAGIYANQELTWSPWLRSSVGLRADQLNAHVDSHDNAANSGASHASQLSPKLSLIFGPWQHTEFFYNRGKGFHSNDARGMTDANAPVPGLVATRGQELGLKSQAFTHLQTTLAVWQLDVDSELVYVGDAGNTVAGRPSRRTGVEWSNHWTPSRHWLLDANLAWTRPRYTDGAIAGEYIVNGVTRVAHFNVTMREVGPWSASVGLRYIGAAPLIENNSVQSSSSLTTNLRVSRRLNADLDVSFDVLNLSNRLNNDISYYYASRVTAAVSSQDGVHVHPAEPRTLRVSARLKY
jgi:outer membrane cobalamin receptor